MKWLSFSHDPHILTAPSLGSVCRSVEAKAWWKDVQFEHFVNTSHEMSTGQPLWLQQHDLHDFTVTKLKKIHEIMFSARYNCWERDWVGFQWSEVSIAIGIGAGIGLDRYRSEVKVFSYATEVCDVDPHGTTYAGNMPVMFCITFGTVTMTIWVSGISRYSELLCQCCLFKKIGISASVKEGLLCTNQFGRVESGSTE